MSVKLLAPCLPSVNRRQYSVLQCCLFVFFYYSLYICMKCLFSQSFEYFQKQQINIEEMAMTFEERTPILEDQSGSLIFESSQDSSGLWKMTELAGDLLHSPCQAGCEAISLYFWSVNSIQSSGGPLSGAPGNGKLTSSPPVVRLHHPSLRSLKAGMLTITMTQAEPSFKADKTSFVHPFEMGPNYVLLINETLWPNRENTVGNICRNTHGELTLLEERMGG